MNDIKNLQTTIHIHAERDQLRHAFPKSDRDHFAVLKRDGEEIWRDWWPDDTLCEVMIELTRDHPDISFEVKNELKLDSSSILIPDFGTFHVNWVKDGVSSIRVVTHGDDEQVHFDRVDKIKHAIKMKGFELDGGKCQITILRECE